MLEHFLEQVAEKEQAEREDEAISNAMNASRGEGYSEE
jgi:hypothetical protein